LILLIFYYYLYF